ncbi:DNA polymerase III subunit beta [Loigolactobacillus coryniformis]|jgi:DNA polymerase-3 subunit beta|uniref:Beta sliding clamp n=2 Tax=Loigolactobacillus coryniformis TaxID=1610 RepID=J3JCF1_9LACO|nr:DNA polymerase III subunit beta [Loigolactobacillus coryniformis]ATO42439.1 DNA polymerase III subunit beta [Loigolactobacillus coryniformis subsp. torquens DSM 20004 = KCTC 3535]ATO54105.1 DNA polymerase III subunit beta [Loigolactobacillus coryniformis subsp. coryniformis KCTC 3167 = DSM 20001]EJN56542.1 DNA polymerase III subunit beta [Loigolactobacillus coryniformis subsp. coryniformis CECT 5711]MBW4801200.1 DNA polymerase III subunit beta [Loigolactobacillus coryniformis subsp. torquens
MQFSIKRSLFIKNLNDVQRAISSKTTIPILTGLKLVLTEAGLMLTGSDADISIEAFISADDEKNELEVGSTGSIVLPARFFGEIVKKLPEDTLTLEVKDNFQTELRSGPAAFTINGLDANNYPNLPVIDTDKQVVLDAAVLKQLIAQTVIAVSNQESRPILTGIHLVLANQELLAVATDSHRLSQRKIQLDIDADIHYDVIIPGKSLVELSRTLGDDVENVEMRIAENQVLFVAGTTSFYSRLLEGNYPETSRLIPTSSSTQVEFNAPQLLSAIERASLLSHESHNNVVKLALDPATNKVTIYGNSPDVGNVEESLNGQNLSGEELEISFNPDYMKDALRSFGQTEIRVAFTSALRPFTLVPTEDADHFIQLITPVRTF